VLYFGYPWFEFSHWQLLLLGLSLAKDKQANCHAATCGMNIDQISATIFFFFNFFLADNDHFETKTSLFFLVKHEQTIGNLAVCLEVSKQSAKVP
jgi:hypothetical protein